MFIQATYGFHCCGRFAFRLCLRFSFAHYTFLLNIIATYLMVVEIVVFVNDLSRWKYVALHALLSLIRFQTTPTHLPHKFI